MWTLKVSEWTDTPAEQIWHLYSNTSLWPQWDAGIVSCTIEGPFATGTRGTLTPEGTDGLPFQLTEVRPGESFTDETHMPGVVLRFKHDLEPTPEGLKVSHTVTLEGPEYREWARTLGAELAAHLPETIRSLIRVASSMTPA